IPRPDQDAVAAAKLAEFEARTGKKPNIVILLIDDMGYGDPGAFGGGEAIGAATPNMDRLAAQGLKLTSTYAQQTCTPTRSAILTGRLPVRTGLTRPILKGDKLTANPWADEISIAAMLSNAGYHTAAVGKWHIGEGEGMRPFGVGFDEWYGFYGAEKEITQEFDQHRYPDLVLDPEKLADYHALGANIDLVAAKKGDTDDTVVIPTTSVEDIAEADLRLRDYSVKRIGEMAKEDKPFFLYHAFMKVHTDNFPSKEFTGASASKYAYKDSVVEVDAIIGDIVNALSDAGVLENTFIFITSDNGPQMDMWPDAGFTPFKGAKGTTWEGGVRVPGIAYWKGMIAPGRVSDGLFDLMDLFNTSLDLAGVKDPLPTDRYFDGVNQTSFLLADNGESERENVYMWMGSTFAAMRMREYKIHTKVIIPQANFLWIDMATMNDVGTAPWLFNLYIDPKEEYAVGHRMSPWLATMGSEMKAHGATFAKFPPKKVGLE
ncbi:MAG: arylsulfatase, partial [Rhodobacteraceae bacterium]|nr:arylsulfatase [Paracoccaceae bacterium]